MQSLWGSNINLITRTRDNKEFTIVCDDNKRVTVVDGNRID